MKAAANTQITDDDIAGALRLARLTGMRARASGAELSLSHYGAGSPYNDAWAAGWYDENRLRCRHEKRHALGSTSFSTVCDDCGAILP